MNPTLDILFRVIGTEVPSDHGYALYGALSRILETEEDQWMHGNPHIGLHTVRGTPLGKWQAADRPQRSPWSALAIRPVAALPDASRKKPRFGRV